MVRLYNRQFIDTTLARLESDIPTLTSNMDGLYEAIDVRIGSLKSEFGPGDAEYVRTRLIDMLRDAGISEGPHTADASIH